MSDSASKERLARECLDEARAKLVRVTSLTSPRAVLLERRFPLVRGLTKADMLSVVDEFTSVENEESSVTVENPRASDEIFPGVWRLVANQIETDPETGFATGLIQRLIRGVVEKFSWDSARVVYAVTADAAFREFNPGVPARDKLKLVVAELPFCAPEKIETIIAEAPSTATNPTIAGETWAGDWTVRAAMVDRIVGQEAMASEVYGLGAIRLFLAQESLSVEVFDRPDIHGGEARYLLYDVPLALVQGILDFWKDTAVAPAASVDINYDRKTAALSLSRRVVKDESAENAGGKDAQWFYHLETGALERHTGGAAPIVATPIEGARVRVENRRDQVTGTWETVRSVEAAEVVPFSFSFGSAAETVRVDAAMAVPLAAVPSMSPADGEQVSGDIDPVDYRGRFRYRISRAQAVSQRGFQEVDSALSRERVDISTAVPPLWSGLPATDGSVVEVEETPTQYKNRVRRTVVVRRAKDAVGYREQQSAFESDITETHSAAPLPPSIGGAQFGAVVELQSSPTPFVGRYAVSRRIRVAKNARADVAYLASAFEQRREIVDTATELGALAGAAVGETVQAQAAPTEFPGKYRVVVVRSKALPLSVVVEEHNAAVVSRLETGRGPLVERLEVTAGDGEEVSAAQEVLPYVGWAETRVQRRRVKNLRSREISEDWFGRSEESVDSATPESPEHPGFTPGTVVKLAVDPTTFQNRNRVRRVTVRVFPRQYGPQVVSQGPYHVVRRRWFWNLEPGTQPEVVKDGDELRMEVSAARVVSGTFDESTPKPGALTPAGEEMQLRVWSRPEQLVRAWAFFKLSRGSNYYMYKGFGESRGPGTLFVLEQIPARVELGRWRTEVNVGRAATEAEALARTQALIARYTFGLNYATADWPVYVAPGIWKYSVTGHVWEMTTAADFYPQFVEE